MSGPLVSVIIPLYNCEQYLRSCIESIINQTYENIEILISDDASTDSSLLIAEEFEKKYPSVRIFRQAKNIGLLKNYNFLFEKSEGEFIAIQDSDDWSEPGRIEEQVNIFLQKKDIMLCGVARVFHYPNNKEVLALKKTDFLLESPTLDYHICPASYMIRKEVLTEIPGLNSYFEGGTSMDRYFITEVLAKYKGYYLNKPLYHHNVRYRSNHKTFSLKKITTMHLCEELISQRIKTGTDWLKQKNYEAIHEFEQKILNDPRILSEEYRASAVFDIEFGNFEMAFQALKQSFGFKISRMNVTTFLYLVRAYLGNIFRKALNSKS